MTSSTWEFPRCTNDFSLSSRDSRTSGGSDSSIVWISLCTAADEQLRAFTQGNGGERFDRKPRSQRMRRRQRQKQHNNEGRNLDGSQQYMSLRDDEIALDVSKRLGQSTCFSSRHARLHYERSSARRLVGTAHDHGSVHGQIVSRRVHSNLSVHPPVPSREVPRLFASPDPTGRDPKMIMRGSVLSSSLLIVENGECDESQTTSYQYLPRRFGPTLAEARDAFFVAGVCSSPGSLRLDSEV